LLDIANLDRILSPGGRRSNAVLKIALFYGFLGIVGGISALSLENPNRQPEIQSPADVFESSGTFSKDQRLIEISS
jgi:hypothetical protein